MKSSSFHPSLSLMWALLKYLFLRRIPFWPQSKWLRNVKFEWTVFLCRSFSFKGASRLSLSVVRCSSSTINTSHSLPLPLEPSKAIQNQNCEWSEARRTFRGPMLNHLLANVMFMEPTWNFCFIFRADDLSNWCFCFLISIGYCELFNRRRRFRLFRFSGEGYLKQFWSMYQQKNISMGASLIH